MEPKNAWSLKIISQKLRSVEKIWCLEGAWRVSGGYLEGVCKVSGNCLEGV